MKSKMVNSQNLKVKSCSAQSDEFWGPPSENISNQFCSVNYNGLLKFKLIFNFRLLELLVQSPSDRLLLT